MSVTIAGIDFENHSYDDRGDVLYLDTKDYSGYPANTDASPEGHGIEWDEAGKVVAMTLVNVKSLIERDGELRITWPDGHVSRDAAPIIAATA